MTNQQNRYAVMFEKEIWRFFFEFVGVDAKHNTFNRPASAVGFLLLSYSGKQKQQNLNSEIMRINFLIENVMVARAAYACWITIAVVVMRDGFSLRFKIQLNP